MDSPRAPSDAWTAQRRHDGSWLITRGDGLARESHVAEAVTDGDGAVWVQVDGETAVLPAMVRDRREAAAPGALEAPMPALVTAILVRIGDVVSKGTPLVLLDAMKMELPLKASGAATVVAVHCAVGERVMPGRILVHLEPRDDPA